MCGIALILSGVHLIGSELFSELHEPRLSDSDAVCGPVLDEEDLKTTLRRRGPDHLGSRRLFLQLKLPNFVKEDGRDKESRLCFPLGHCQKNRITSAFEAASAQDGDAGVKSVADLYFIGATLQLRGVSPVFQPLVDACGNLLVYNGEIFGGIHVAADSNDAETLLHALERCDSCNCHPQGKNCLCEGKGKMSVPEILSTIKGPWALIYWQERSKTLWFGRDAFGRRSLVVHWPTATDSCFVLSSVSPPSAVRRSCDSEAAHTGSTLCYWEELPCGIYSINLMTSIAGECGRKEKLVGEVRKHEWTDILVGELIKWERPCVDPESEKVISYDIPLASMKCAFQSTFSNEAPSNGGHFHPAFKVLTALREAVKRRISFSRIYEKSLHQAGEEDPAPVSVLFSGGLDSMILAALLDQCLDCRYTIDLLNVSFDGELAPDRVSARMGVRELQHIASARRWRLVEIDASLAELSWETQHLMSLIHPAKTYMDLNIGIALWLAAGGDGWVDDEIYLNHQETHCQYKYKSAARILLVGSGADEQCAGYGRHRTKYRIGGWVALQEEMKLDMQRIWKRNLGRDDRCISDHGREARFPFLDEDVMRTLLEIPLWEIANLNEPVGVGDKKILREVAKLLGLEGAAILPKKAIQFGSRIARESNRKNFGSNRAANQVSAGSVEIHEH